MLALTNALPSASPFSKRKIETVKIVNTAISNHKKLFLFDEFILLKF